MSFKGITITTPEESLGNITAADDAAIFQSLIGSDGVLNIGSKFAATVISNNKVRVADGVLCVGGHMGRTAHGDYNDMTIENGVSGQNRNDIIYAKFLTSGSSDTFTLAVKKGTGSTGTAEDPALVQGDLYENATLREFPLWRVQLEGLSIKAVEPMFEAIPTIPDLNLKTVKNYWNLISVAGHTDGVRTTGSYTVPFDNVSYAAVDVSNRIPSGYKISQFCMAVGCINSNINSFVGVAAVVRHTDTMLLVKLSEVITATLEITLQFTMVPA